jgi:hypothetical protein
LFHLGADISLNEPIFLLEDPHLFNGPSDLALHPAELVPKLRGLIPNGAEQKGILFFQVIVLVFQNVNKRVQLFAATALPFMGLLLSFEDVSHRCQHFLQIHDRRVRSQKQRHRFVRLQRRHRTQDVVDVS